ncbi:protocatechuate 3,4-dioxygenase subunit alpha [Yoonia sp. SS1-5]|uniref:Protocatechuate 3,4-dioxygenase subunit alpha n=1 Tax=Yoonia rhodophyticola TaxID=3137370 RepID=A0ABZ3JC39_9RHOB
MHIGLMPQDCGVSKPAQLGALRPTGTQPIEITGTVWDGDGAPVKDVLIEVWQADEQGQTTTDGHAYWQRVASDFETGKWQINTVKPGTIGNAAPHLTLWIVARGVNIGLHTRLYFPDDALDAVLQSLPVDRRATLLAQQDGNNPARYTFNIHLQGDKETVFFDV